MEKERILRIIKESWWYKLRTENYPDEWIRDDLSYFRQVAKFSEELIPSLKLGAMGLSMFRLYLKRVSYKKKLKQRSLKSLQKEYGKLKYVYFVAYVSMRLRNIGFSHEQVRRHLVFCLSLFPIIPLCAVFIAYEKYVRSRKKYESGGEEKALSRLPEDLRPYAVLFAQLPEMLK